ncbi:MAG: hypothetical protein FWC61_00845 [Proteobacteria bacterium]|nr:hypothetical protein [Pseudomonadota bacterium]
MLGNFVALAFRGSIKNQSRGKFKNETAAFPVIVFFRFDGGGGWNPTPGAFPRAPTQPPRKGRISSLVSFRHQESNAFVPRVGKNRDTSIASRHTAAQRSLSGFRLLPALFATFCAQSNALFHEEHESQSNSLSDMPPANQIILILHRNVGNKFGDSQHGYFADAQINHSVKILKSGINNQISENAKNLFLTNAICALQFGSDN